MKSLYDSENNTATHIEYISWQYMWKYMYAIENIIKYMR